MSSRSPVDALAALCAAFGDQVTVAPLAGDSNMGRRIHGVDLSGALTPEQADAVIGALDAWQVISFPNQIDNGMTVTDLERLANHFGAPIPHPSNIDNYLDASAARLKTPEARPSTQVNAAFPGQVSCLPGGDSAAVYLVTNLIGSGPDATPVISGGQHWHTDIEFEPVPLSTSMFLVHHVPTARNEHGTWVTNPSREPGFYHPESPALLAERREALPLNGETAYADTAAAYDALDASEQAALDKVMVRRRLQKGDDGFLMPLVYENPRTRRKSLHSPIWASRGKRVAPAQVEGMDATETRHFLDRLEQHCLDPRFRYDHVHAPGDVTIWDNFATLHVAPPSKRPVNDPADARLMYRISCKGPTSPSLPRSDSDAWLTDNVKPPYRSPVFT